MNQYTLNELSDELDISVDILKKHINQGTLRATKIDRTFWITSSDVDKFLDADVNSPVRNYLCQHYDTCLDKAAIANKSFSCKNCRKFTRAEKQLLTPGDLEGILTLWGTVFDEKRISAN